MLPLGLRAAAIAKARYDGAYPLYYSGWSVGLTEGGLNSCNYDLQACAIFFGLGYHGNLLLVDTI